MILGATDRAEPTRVVHRTVVGRDLGFLTNSWLRSYERAFVGPPSRRTMDRAVYYAWHHKILEAAIPRSTTIVACDADDPDRIYGWGCARYEGPNLLVHYLYTKEQFRQLGVATSILRAWIERFDPKAIVATHSTPAWRSFIEHARREGVITVPTTINPYLAILEIAAESDR